ncbi:unnamed protein product [Rotaria sordida]|uniref:Uncharacterized protein n=1 Tax=Rotaria sordida TaxID=392033 RepID=A0A813WP47_9BILA|nr:unnamed protein product [Rotaria sordida]CAF0891813.1 unnamed protein product [Rotaria sordida]
MVKTMTNEYDSFKNEDSSSKVPEKGKTVIIQYDPPKVVVVRRYTRTVIHSVDPDQYNKQFDSVLLDTETLLEWTRRLNIQENMITPPSFKQTIQ